MSMEAINREKPVVVVCGNGKISEAAVFLLLRNKINAMILSGGMADLKSDPKRGIAANNIAANAERSETLHQHHETLQSTDNEQNNQIRLLQAEVAELKTANQQLNDKCLKVELGKQNTEKQARIFYKQLREINPGAEQA